MIGSAMLWAIAVAVLGGMARRSSRALDRV